LEITSRGSRHAHALDPPVKLRHSRTDCWWKRPLRTQASCLLPTVLGRLVVLSLGALVVFLPWSRPFAGLSPPPAPFIETLDVSRWPDLLDQHRQRLIDGALDGLDREGDPLVRALAARLLSLIAVSAPASVLPRLHERAQALSELLTDTAEDDAAGDLAAAAYVTLFVVDPRRFTWIEPPLGHAAAALSAGHRVLKVGGIAPSADHSPLRKIAGGALDDGDWSVRQAGVEMLASGSNLTLGTLFWRRR
jgi:hypothetical protein